MSALLSRPFAGEADLRSLIAFAQRVSSERSPAPAYYHPGDFVWQLYAFDATDDVRLWVDGGRPAGGPHVVACAVFEPPLNFQYEVDLRADESYALTDEIIAWAEGRRALVADEGDVPIAYEMLRGTLATIALDSDATRIAALERHGYARTERGGTRFARSLDAPIDTMLPAGARVRHATDADIAERADLHRDAWSVWGTSGFSEELYRRLRAAPLYDEELDIVVEADGRLVSYCIGWLDAVNGAGYFEPVGTRPSAAGRGYGRAAVIEGQRRMRERGMGVATVGTASINEPAAALYRSAGMAVVGREHFYVKEM